MKYTMLGLYCDGSRFYVMDDFGNLVHIPTLRNSGIPHYLFSH